MLPLDLTANQCRVIGCLMEKAVTTPEQYPLTLNALVNACNQKSSRDPVMSLSPGTVQHTARELEQRHLLRVEPGVGRGVEKYAQRFCNTRYSELQFDPAQYALVCLLLLRGAQTPGELRARSGRLHEFSDNRAVQSALESLNQLQPEALVVQLPRTPGRKDSEYMHLFSGEVDVEAVAAQLQSEVPGRGTRGDELERLEQRVSVLEAELAELKRLLL